MIDLGIGLDKQAASFYVSLVVTAIIVIASIPTFLGEVGV